MFIALMLAAQTKADILGKAERLLVDGAPVSVEQGHADPLLYDWDGDGKLDLLVGQYEKGMLNVFLGKSKKPGDWAAPFKAMAGDSEIAVSYG